MGVHVRKTKSGWLVEVYWKGTRGLRRFGNDPESERQSNRFAEKIRAVIEKGDPWMLEKMMTKTERKVTHETRTPSIKQFSEKWLKEVELIVRPSTFSGYLGSMLNHIIPAMGDVRIDDVDYQVIKNFIALKVAEGLSKGSIQYYLAALSAMLQEAVREGIIDSKPSYRTNRLLSSAKQQEAVEPFTIDELNILEEKAAVHRTEYRDILCILRRTGARIGEVLALQFADIDWAKQTIRISKTMPTALSTAAIDGPKPTKTKSSVRDVDLSGESLLMLRRRYLSNQAGQLQDPADNPRGYVFAGREGAAMLYHGFRKFFAKLQQQAGIRVRGIHNLRHSYASNLLSMGAELPWVQKQLGHASSDMTLRIYTKWMPKEGKSKADWMDKNSHQTHISVKDAIHNESK